MLQNFLLFPIIKRISVGLIVPTDVLILWLSNPLAMNVSDDGYLNYATCTLHYISMFLLQFFHLYVSYILDY